MRQTVESVLFDIICQEFEPPDHRGSPRIAPHNPRIACQVCLQLPKADRARRMFFTSAAAMEAHVQAMHPALTCDLCDRAFTGEIALQQHRTMKHGEPV